MFESIFNEWASIHRTHPGTNKCNLGRDISSRHFDVLELLG